MIVFHWFLIAIINAQPVTLAGFAERSMCEQLRPHLSITYENKPAKLFCVKGGTT